MKQLKRSPWGSIQQWQNIADGIALVATASHGGIKLDRSRQARMPKALALTGGWYEEDLEYARVIVAFPDAFKPEEVAHANAIMSVWYPDAYEASGGKTVSANEPQVRWEQIFRKAHHNDYVSQAAWGDWHHAIPKGSVGVLAQRGSDNDIKYFLVPQTEYASQRRGFVVDLKRHPIIKPLS